MPAARRRSSPDTAADLGPQLPRRRGERVAALAADPADPNKTIRRAVVAWAPGQLYAAGRLSLAGLQAAERWRDGHAMAQHGRGNLASFLRDSGGGRGGVALAEAIMQAAADLRRCRAALSPVLCLIMDQAAAEEAPVAAIAARFRLSEHRAGEIVVVAAMKAAEAWGMAA